MNHPPLNPLRSLFASLTLGLTTLTFGADLPSGPSPSVPAGGRAPGDYPNFTVTGANWVMDASAVMDINGGLRDEVILNLAGQGPLPWSLTEFGQGRYAPRLNVGDPQAAASNLGKLPFDLIIDGTAYEWQNDIDPWAPNGAAWRPAPTHGILLATTRKNGQEWNDGEPLFHGVLSIQIESSGGEGYSMANGSFGTGDTEIKIGKAGSAPQGSLDTSTAWFPYDQGWIGGHVASADFQQGEWFADGYHHPDLPADPADMITWTRELGFIVPPVTVSLPGVNARTDGMLFTMGIGGPNSNTRITAADPNADGSGWEVMIRSDSEPDPEFAEEVGLAFLFLYVPYDSVNLIGGHIRGSDANVINGRGNYTIRRLATGQYELAIPGKRTGDGTLILGAAGRLQNRPSVIGRNFLSYEPNADGDRFLIESHYFRSENDNPLEDSDFYFAWVDFATPLAPPGFESAIDPPTISNQPSSVSIELGASTTFSVTATGTEPFIYQWTKDGSPIVGATEPEFSVTDATLESAGDYQVQVTNAGGQATSNTATLKVLAPPNITLEPRSVDAAVGDTVTFESAATGTPPLVFQWQKDGVDVPGANAARLTLPNIGIADAGQYRVRVSNEVNEAFSTTARLTVQAVSSPPQFTQVPQNQTVEQGQTVTFRVAVSGTPPIAIQWQRNGQNLPGATDTTLTLSNVQAANAGSYQAQATNAVGITLSPAAQLTVNVPPPVIDPPSIVQHPQSLSVETGQAARLQVLATGNQLTYQWQKDGANLSGANASAYEILATAATDAGRYTVIISNPGGQVTSNPATLTVNTPPPVGDTLQIVTQPASQTVAPGDTVTFTVVAQGTAPLSYQWQLGTFNIPGARSASFSISGVQQVDEGAYRVVVSDSTGSVTSNPATLTVSTAPVIVTQPQSQSITEGATVTFSVSAQGQSPLTYQWQFNGSNIPGARGQQFSVSGVQSADEGNYQVVVTDSGGSTTSGAATLTVVPRPANELSIRNISLSGNTLSIEWDGGPGIVLQAKANLSDPVWQDVPGTDGQSSAQQLALGLSAYFRLIHR